MSVYIKNNTQDNVGVLVPNGIENKKIDFYVDEVAELTNIEYDYLIKNNKLFKKFFNSGKLVKVSKPEIKKVEDLEVKNKSLEIEVKEQKKQVSQKEEKIESLEKELSDLRAKLNKKAQTK